MREQFQQYLVNLNREVPVPMSLYEGMLSLLCLGTTVIIVFYGLKRGWRKIAGLLLVEYIFVIYCSTVIFRSYAETRGHNFMPFWSYYRPELLVENIMNVGGVCAGRNILGFDLLFNQVVAGVMCRMFDVVVDRNNAVLLPPRICRA